MTEKDNKNRPSMEGADSKLRATEKRRQALKKMTIAGGTVAAVGASSKWAKPVVDSLLLPAHAQTSATPTTPPPPPLGNISAAWFLGDDAPGGYDTGVTDTLTVTDSFLYDDGTDMRINATLTPAAAVGITATFDFGATSFGSLAGALPTPTANADTGVADFGAFDPTNSDFGDAPGAGTITLTLSAPGYNNKVIILNVS